MLIDGSITKNLKSFAFWALAGALVAASFSNSLFEIFSGFFMILSLFLIVVEKKGFVFKSLFGLAVGIYLLIVFLSLTQSNYPSESLRGVFRVLRCAWMCFSVIYLVNDEKKFERLFYLLVATAIVIGVDALVQGVFGIEFLRGRQMTPFTEQAGRVTGPFGHANDFSAYLSFSIFLFIGLLGQTLHKRSWKKLGLCLGGAALLGTCLLWTYARGAWLAVAVSCGAMLIFQRSRVLLATILMVAALIFFLAPPSLKARAASLWNPLDGTVTERRALWTEALQMTAQKPWLGYGINTYSKIEPQFKSKLVYTDKQYAHNGYLQIAAETGWVGLTSFFAVLISFLLAAFKKQDAGKERFLSAAAAALTFGIISLLIHSAMDTDLQSLRLVSFLWLSMGLVLAAKNILKDPIL